MGKATERDLKKKKTEVVVTRGGEGYGLGLTCPLTGLCISDLGPQVVALFGTFSSSRTFSTSRTVAYLAEVGSWW